MWRWLLSSNRWLLLILVRYQILWCHIAPYWRPYLHLLERNLKAEGLVVVRIQSVLLHCRLLLLQPLSILQQVNLHVGIWRKGEEQEIYVVKDLVKGRVQQQLQCPGSPTDGACAEAGDYCMVQCHIGWARNPPTLPRPLCRCSPTASIHILHLDEQSFHFTGSQTWQEDAAWGGRATSGDKAIWYFIHVQKRDS